jgi:hypothetical protein
MWKCFKLEMLPFEKYSVKCMKLNGLGQNSPASSSFECREMGKFETIMELDGT